MSIAEKLTTVAENVEKVYWAGYSNGDHTGNAEGYTRGQNDKENEMNEHLAEPIATINSYLDEPTDPESPHGRISYLNENIPEVHENGKTAGQQEEYDRFWDSYINGRTNAQGRLSANSMFCYWSSNVFYPPVDIKPYTVSSMFQGFCPYDAEPLDLKARLDECGVTLDFSGMSGATSYMFSSANISKLPIIDLSTASELASTFMRCKVQEIEGLYFNDTGTQPIKNAFDYCENLVTISEIRGIIGNDINFQWCPLSKDSITSVVDALKLDASGKTLTLNKSAVNTAFGIDVDDETTYPDGSEYYILRHSKDNWTFNYS